MNQHVRLYVLGACALAFASGAAAGTDRPMAIRGQNPFTRVFGLPMYPAQQLLAAGEWDGSAVLDIVNHANVAAEGAEQVILDGETYLFNLLATYAPTNTWQVGVDVPYVRYDGGFTDSGIEGWHDLWGFSNANRDGQRDQLRIRYADQTTFYDIVEDNSGLGDLRLWSSFTFKQTPTTRLAARATLKLPTGDSDDLHGSGAADIALDVSIVHQLHAGKTRLSLSGHAGLLALGDGDVLSQRQEDLVPYGGVGLVWALSDHWDLLTQIQAQGSYFDSDLNEVGGSAVQISAGVRYCWARSNWELVVGFAEDLVSDSTPDFALRFELRKRYGKGS